MHSLDIRTLFASYLATVLMCAVALAVLWVQNRKRFPATSYWLASFSLQLLAITLVILRGAIPDSVSIVGSFVAATTAALLLRKGLENFFGSKLSSWGDSILVTATLCIHLYFTFVAPSLVIRNINYAALQLLVFSQCSLVASRGSRANGESGVSLLSAVLMSTAALNAIRIVAIAFVDTGDAFFLPNTVDAGVYLVYGVLMAGITLSLVMQINQRLQLNLQSDMRSLVTSQTALEESERKLKRAESMGHLGHWALNLQTREITGSEQAALIYGLATNQIDYETIRKARLEEYAEDMDAALSDLVLHGKPYDRQFKVRQLDSGEIRDVHSLAVYDAASHSVFGIVRDITEQKVAERKLFEREGIFRMAVETSPAGFWITDSMGKLLDVNAAYEQLSGYSRDELLQMHISDLDAMETTEQTRAHIAELIRVGHGTFEVIHRRKDGSQWPVEVVTSYSPAFGGRFFAFLRDISEKRSIEELNWHHANFDRLTDLPNRALLFDRLSTACVQARRDRKLVGFLFLDLDGFKSVNDKHGHEAGDAVLVEASRRLTACVRSSDTVARIGGDEFSMVLGGLTQVNDLEVIASKAIEEMQRPVDLPNGTQCTVGISIGISLYPNDALEMDRLIALADEAMYESKRRGKNTFSLARSADKVPELDSQWVHFTADETLGIGPMDSQHRHLVDMLNTINTAINAADPQKNLNAMFSDLVAYTAMHFATELDLMQRYHYPELTRHDREHTLLVQEVKALVNRFEEGAQLATLQVLKDWLVGHIHTSDRKLANFLIGKGCQ